VTRLVIWNEAMLDQLLDGRQFTVDTADGPRRAVLVEATFRLEEY
jgi:hypothetical protein